jgi:hypothetical protein
MELEDDRIDTAADLDAKAPATETKRDGDAAGFLHIMGKPGQKYSLEGMEFGMGIMSHGMSAQTARDTMRSMMHRLHPGLVEGKGHRVPGTTMLKRLRRLLEPVCHFMSPSALDRADMMHLLSDACTKRHVGIF